MKYTFCREFHSE